MELTIKLKLDISRSYKVGDWSECSKTCGAGLRSRTVLCQQLFVGNFTTTVTHRKCLSYPKPSTKEICRMQECASWDVIGAWSEVNCIFN